MHRRAPTLSLALASALLFPQTANAAPAASNPTPAGDAQPQATDSPPTRRARALRLGGAALMGLGAALLIPMTLGITEHSRATATVERFNELAISEDRQFTLEEFKTVESAYGHGRRMRTLAITTGLASGAALISGLALYLTGARASRYDLTAARRVLIHPSLSPRNAGLTLTTRF